MSVSVSTAATMTISSVSITNTVVSTITDYLFSALCGAPVSTTYQMSVTFPSDFALGSSAVLKGYFGINRSVTTSVTSNTISFVTGFSGYLDGTNTIEFDISQITNPISVKPSQFISFTVLTSDNKAVCTTSAGYSVTATVGSISSITITPTDDTIYSVTTYTFSMTLNEIVPSTGYIVINFPSQISIAARSAAACTSIISGLSSSTLCAVASSSLTLTNCFTTSYSGTISFSINQVTNPTTTAATSNFEIIAYSSDKYEILYNKGTSITASPGSLQSASIEASSLITGQITSYTISFVVSHTVPAGGVLYIVLPSQNSFSSPVCSSPIGLSTSYTCSFSSTTVTISNGFTTSFSAGTIGLKISGVVNPGTTKPSDSAQFYTESNSYVIDTLSAGLTVTMTTAHTFTTVTASTSSSVVGQTATFSFTITPYNPMYSSGTVTITAPSTVSFPNSPSCSPLGATATVVCSMSGSNLQATVTFASSTITAAYGFQVSSCRNPTSTAPTSSFQVFSFTSSYGIDQITQGVTLTVSTPASLSASVTAQDYGISVSTQYSFQITTTNSVPEGGYFQIVFPSTVTPPTSPVCTGSSSCSVISSNTLDIYYTSTSLSASSSITLNISPLTNPSTTGSINFSITSMTSGYSIDYIYPVSLSITCHSPCSTCQTSADFCLTCLTSYPYFYQNYCYTKCPSGSTATSSALCQTCVAPCAQCSGSTTYCTSCVSPEYLYSGACVTQCGPGTFIYESSCLDCSAYCNVCTSSTVCTACNSGYYLYESACVAACVGGTVGIDGVCVPCSSPCYTCTNTASICTACVTGYSLTANQCQITCPDTTTSVNSVCSSCSSPCINCAEAVTNCTSCQAYWYLYSGTCVASCPSNTIVIGNTCAQCSSQCAVCSGTTNNCLQCVSTAFFYDNMCYSACPDHTTSINSVCTNCTSPCSECLVSTTHCTSCINTYFLYDGSCVTSCPSLTTIAYSDHCNDCTAPCFTCSGAEKNCTSCVAGYLLYAVNNTCVAACPAGYQTSGNVCEEILCAPGCTEELLNNTVCDAVCDYQACDWDNNTCGVNDTSTVPLQQAPLPFTVSSIGTGSIVGASKMIFPTTSMVSATLGFWGAIETASWLGVLGKMSQTDNVSGRRLLSSDSDIQLAFILLLLCAVGHFFINITFAVVYFFGIFRKDTAHQFWLSNKCMTKWLIVPLAVLISFKFIRLIDVKLFGLSCFSAKFDRKSNLYRPLVLFSYISIVLTTLPTMGSLIYILVIYSKSSIVFVLAMDSLIITVLVLILTIYDIIMLSLILEEHSKANATQVGAMDTQTLGFEPQRFDIFNTKGDDTERDMMNIAITSKIHPEPEDEYAYRDTNADGMVPDILHRKNTDDHMLTEEDLEEAKGNTYNSRPNMWNISFESPQMRMAFAAPPRILEVIPEEIDLDLSSVVVDEDRQDSVVLQHKASGRRILVSKTFRDAKKLDESDSDITPVDPDEYLLQEVDRKNVHIGLMKSRTTGNIVKLKRNFSGSTVLDVQLEKDGDWTIGKTVRKEEDYDFQHAFEDPDDPEAVVVWNKLGRVYCVIKKNFKGVPKLDPRTNLPIFTERIVSAYDTATLQIDSRNCHFANLVTDGKLTRVRRNFIGAKVVEVIDQDNYLERKRRRAEMTEEPELEIKAEDTDSEKPEVPIPTSAKSKKPRKPKKPKPKGWENIEAIYLQRLEPSLKPRSSPGVLPNSVIQSPLDDSHITNLNMKPSIDADLDALRRG